MPAFRHFISILSSAWKRIALSCCVLSVLLISLAVQHTVQARTLQVPFQQISPLSPLQTSDPTHSAPVAPQATVVDTQLPIFVGNEADQTSLVLVGALFFVLVVVVLQAMHRQRS